MGRIKSLWQKREMYCRGLGGEKGKQGVYRRYTAEGIAHGSRRSRIPGVRSEIAERLIKELAMPLAEVARLWGGSTSAISKILQGIAQERSE
jgi:hypothetical protein